MTDWNEPTNSILMVVCYGKRFNRRQEVHHSSETLSTILSFMQHLATFESYFQEAEEIPDG